MPSHLSLSLLPPQIPVTGVRRCNSQKNLGIADANRRFFAYFGNKQQQFNTPGFITVNLSNSVEWEILQVGEKPNEQ
jgi:hypothetical protein